MRTGAFLGLVIRNKEGLAEDLKISDSLGCSDHGMMEFMIMQGRSRVISRL